MARFKLRRIDEYNHGFRDIAERYRSSLSSFTDCPDDDENTFCVFHNFVVKTAYRDELRAFLQITAWKNKNTLSDFAPRTARRDKPRLQKRELSGG